MVEEEDKSYFPQTAEQKAKPQLYSVKSLMRVRDDCKKPSKGWGKVTRKSVGVMVACFDNSYVQINFPEQEGAIFLIDEVP